MNDLSIPGSYYPDKRTAETVGLMVGETIASVARVEGDDDKLLFTMADGTVVSMFDDGQDCCEHRYMTCDDDLTAFAGATFMRAEIRDGHHTDMEYDEVHEIEFLVITTSAGSFTVATHNEHNGYYGGFHVVARID